MREVVQIDRSVGLADRQGTTPELHHAMMLLNEAIALLDDFSLGKSALSLAAAHVETALYLVEAELDPDPRG